MITTPPLSPNERDVLILMLVSHVLATADESHANKLCGVLELLNPSLMDRIMTLMKDVNKELLGL